ncbi:VanZ family protein [Marisediminicola sp. LYQ134]|uniref:VanZ family protein n=1 Tax=Marisediminicola sp. LYQ134 TaxID=3391061 RepID=UPI003983A71F
MVYAARPLLVLYVVACLAVVLWPTPVDRSVAGDLHQLIGVLNNAGLTVVTYTRIEMTANVLMFVPLGALGVLSFPRIPWWVVPVACLELSAAVELTQLLFIEQRFSTLSDVASNSIGALLGAAAVVIGRRGSRANEPHASAQAPSAIAAFDR